MINFQAFSYFKHKFNLIWAGIGFGIFYWIMESVRDVLVFEKGVFIHRVFLLDPMSFWMRLMVVCIIILFSVYVQSLKDKIRTNNKKSSLFSSIHIIRVGFGFGLLYWFLESFRDVIIGQHGGLIERIINPGPVSFWMRMLVILILFLFCIYIKILVNESKQVHEALREEDERLKQIIHQMPYPVMVCKPDGTSLNINQAFIDVFNINDRNQIIGTFNIRNSKFIEKLGIKINVKDAFLGKTVFLPEIHIPLDHLNNQSNSTKNNVIIQEVTLFPVFRRTGEIWRVVAISKDITEQKIAEENNRKIQSQLLQSQKMEAVGILAGGIAHDFNNILTAIQGCSDMVMMDMPEDNHSFQDMKQIKKSSCRAATLTQQLLLFSRKHPMRFASIQLNKLIKDLTNMLTRLIGEDITIHIDLDPNLWIIQADSSTIEQIIMNLVVNSRAAMTHGGKLTIKTENIMQHKSTFQNGSKKRSGPYVCLSVTDTGLGMSKDILQHIFEPFFSTKGPGIGTGLGLSVVFGIVQQHEGWINVNSDLGHGTKFNIYLPAINIEIEEKLNGAKSNEIIKGKGERLLVVEDDNDVREFTVRALNRSGYSVISAASAEEAIELFEKEDQNFHLVLSDVVLPGKTGIELADELISKNPNIRIVLGSGYMDQKSQWSVIKQKGFRFLKKPYKWSDLAKTVNDAITDEN